MDLLNNFSTREKNLWSELLVDIVVSLYYFPQMFYMMQIGDEALTGSTMTNLITSTVMVAIFAVIIISVFLHYHQKPEHVDERDHMFEARGSRIAYFTLVGLIVLIMGVVVMQELGGGLELNLLPLITPVGLAHLLLFALVFSSAAKTIVQLMSYRRGF